MNSSTGGHQPREHPVPCPNHRRRHPRYTWNWSGLCDECERAVQAAARVDLTAPA